MLCEGMNLLAHGTSIDVLILVLMEYALREDEYNKIATKLSCVLILVLMEYALRED